jgi:hypothetical protein
LGYPFSSPKIAQFLFTSGRKRKTLPKYLEEFLMSVDAGFTAR